MTALLLACASMALKDCLGVFLTVAEARGRALLAGIFDALFDLAQLFIVVYGFGVVLRHGWTAHSVLVVGAMIAVSFVGTMWWTQLSRRIQGVPTPNKTEDLVALQNKVADLEATILLMKG